MLNSKMILTLTGITVITLSASACSPRQSVQNALRQSNQNIASQSPNMNNTAIGSTGLPLYQSSSLNDTTSSQSLIASRKLPDIATNEATGSIKPQSYPKTNTALSGSEMHYTVQSGDTIYSIGREFKVHPQHIIARNRMASPNSLHIGQLLVLPNHNNYNQSNVDNSLNTGSIRPSSKSISYNNSSNTIPQYPKKSSQSSTTYVIQPGDTMYSIGRKLDIHPQYIINNNPSVVPTALQPGQILNISQGKTISKPTHVSSVTPTKKNTPAPSKSPNNDIQKNILANALLMPVSGSIQENSNLRGILIKANDGDAVKASASGEVIYVGNLNNYGNMILVRHDNGLVTNYARLKKTFVQKGQKVNQGDLIASAGSSKDYQGADVLFEVRKGTKAVNPLDYLG